MGIVDFFKNLNNNTLYFPGSLTKTVRKEELENYKKIFDKLDIPYMLLEETVDCGAIAMEAGYKKDAKALAEKNLSIFKEHKVTKIITSNAISYYFFKIVYPTLLREWDIEVEHATTSILEALKKKRISFKGTELDREEVVYHDSCYLARHTKQIEEPREIIERLGGKVLEFENNRENTLSCGASGGFLAHKPEEAKKVAQILINQAPHPNCPVITACVASHTNMSQVSERSMELSTFIIQKLKHRGY